MTASLDLGFPEVLSSGRPPKNGHLVMTFGHLLHHHVRFNVQEEVPEADVHQALSEFFKEAVTRGAELITQSRHQTENKPWDTKTIVPSSLLHTLLSGHLGPLLKCSLQDLFVHAHFEGKEITTDAGPTAISSTTKRGPARIKANQETIKKDRTPLAVHAQLDTEIDIAIAGLPPPTAVAAQKARDIQVRTAAFTDFAIRGAEAFTELVIESGVDRETAESGPYLRVASAFGSMFGNNLLQSDRLAFIVSASFQAVS